MRSFEEIAFRVRQELANVSLYALTPELPESTVSVSGLPSRDALRVLNETAFAAEITRLADRIAAGDWPLLGFNVAVGNDTRWRRDFISGIETPAAYFRRIPYLDPSQAGDHKNIWELNRHQHLVVLAQAAALTGERRYTEALSRELNSWLEQNPFQRGINWASALEVAFRAWSWIWILHLAGDALDAGLRSRFFTALYQHGLHLEYNLSFYFSPNTHLLGEAVVLHLLGKLLPDLPRSRRWERLGGDVTAAQMEAQMRPDGSHFEQSSYYHVYAVDFFLLHHLFAASTPAGYSARLVSAFEYLHALAGPQGRIPLIGDDDGGRLFHPFGERDAFCRATLATGAAAFGRPEWLRDKRDLLEQAVWWIGPSVLQHAPPPAAPARTSAHFPGAGAIVLQPADTHLVFDAGPFGGGTAGHSHSDTLAFTLWHRGEDLLVDAGTFTYVGDPRWREWFRGSAAHNTLRIDGRDQASGAGPFRWLDAPGVELLECRLEGPDSYIDAVCSYSGVLRHRRRLWLRPGDLLCIVDTVEGAQGSHAIEQFWHSGVSCRQIGPAAFRLGAEATLATDRDASLETGRENGWRSRVLGAKEEAAVISWRATTELPFVAATAIFFGATDGSVSAALRDDGTVVVVCRSGGNGTTVEFPASGVASVSQ